MIRKYRPTFLPPVAIAALLLAMIILTADAVYSDWAAETVLNSVSDIQRKRLTLDRLRGVEKSLLDAETGERGYLLTADETYLGPYHGAKKRLPNELDGLRTRLAGTAADERDFARLEALVDDKLAELDAAIATRRSGGIDAAGAMVKVGRGKQAMDELRALIDERSASEDQAVGASRRQMIDRLSDAQSIHVAAAILVLAVLLVFAYLVMKHLRRRARAERALQRVQDNHEIAVGERTKELSMLARHLLNAHEEEQSLLAAELQQRFSAYLAILNRTLDALRNTASNGHGASAAMIAPVQREIDALSASQPRVQQMLHAFSGDGAELFTAIRAEARQFSERHHIVCAVDCDGDCADLERGPATAAFRIVREALTNVARHSRATHVAILLRCTSDALMATVADDGVGIAAAGKGTKTSGAFGLLSMRERVAGLGGELSIVVSPNGTGVVVSVRLPRLPRTQTVQAEHAIGSVNLSRRAPSVLRQKFTR